MTSRDCLLYARGAVHTLWRRDDPLPSGPFRIAATRQAAGRSGGPTR